MNSQQHGSEISHVGPGPATYVKLAIILGIITIVEVATYYIEASALLLTIVLIVLSAAKFALVVMYYMHLKYEARLLTGVFVWGLFVAASIMAAMIALYSAF